VWHQALVEQKKIIAVGAATFPVRRTSKHCLAQIDFQVDRIGFCALEQNPQTKFRWAKRPVKARKSCSFYEQADTLAWSLTES
jgi:hypothetical protein